MEQSEKSALSHFTSEYKKLFSSVFTVLSLLLICVALGAAVVFPLWRFATTHERVYTAVCLIIIVSLVLAKVVLKIRNAGLKKSLYTACRLLVILSGIAFACIFVLQGKRLIALLAVLAAFIVYGCLHVFFHSKANA